MSTALIYDTLGACLREADPWDETVRTVTAPKEIRPGTATGCSQNETHDITTIRMSGIKTSVM